MNTVITKNKLAKAAIAVAVMMALSGCNNDSDDNGDQKPTPELPNPPVDHGTPDAALSIFDNAVKPEWAMYNSSDYGLAQLVQDPADEDRQVVQFTVADNGETVAGFTARSGEEGHNAVGGMPFDASALIENGKFSFDLKVTNPTPNAGTGWSIKFEDSNGNSAEVPFAAGPTDVWQTFTFSLDDIADTLPPEWAQTGPVDLSAIELVMMYPNWQTGDGAVYLVDNVAIYGEPEVVEDTEAPVITLKGDATMTLQNGSAFVDPGYSVTDNVDQAITVVVGGDQVDTSVDGTYVITYDAADAAGNQAATVKRTVIVETADTVAPVITLNGEANISIIQHEAYVEAGATATDNVDGDISDQIDIDSSAVDTSTLGDYQVTYNVMDMAGNQAAELVRNVKVVAPAGPDKLIQNGDFEQALGDEWQSLYTDAGEDTTVMAIENGQLVISNVAPIINPFALRLRQTGIELEPHQAYVLKFDAMASADRNVTVQLGKLADDMSWQAYVNDFNVSITSTMQSFKFISNPVAGIAENNPGDLLFALGGGALPVTFDNISLHPATEADYGPEITLQGDVEMTINVGDQYVEPGYSAQDNVDGDVSGNVIVVSNVDTSTAGRYTVTYDVTDSDGNKAPQKTRVVTVIESNVTSNLVVNGDFSAADLTPWTVNDPAGAEFANGTVKLTVDRPANVTLSQTGIGIDKLAAGQEVVVKFRAKGIAEIGGVVKAAIWAGGIPDFFVTIVANQPDWTEYSFTRTINGQFNPSEGLKLDFIAECGAVTDCRVEMELDDIIIEGK